MSLRRGHLRSGMWAPPALRDDWRDEAKCAGMEDMHVDPGVCVDCPVKEQCGTLYDSLDVTLEYPLPGTWRGIAHGERADHPAVGNRGGGRYPKGVQPVNGGTCPDPECQRDAYRQGMCSMHYQRMLRER